MRTEEGLEAGLTAVCQDLVSGQVTQVQEERGETGGGGGGDQPGLHLQHQPGQDGAQSGPPPGSVLERLAVQVQDVAAPGEGRHTPGLRTAGPTGAPLAPGHFHHQRRHHPGPPGTAAPADNQGEPELTRKGSPRTDKEILWPGRPGYKGLNPQPPVEPRNLTIDSNVVPRSISAEVSVTRSG